MIDTSLALEPPTGSPRQTLRDRVDQRVFNAIYSRSLVYNTCWEDPAVDRRALMLRPEDRVLVITSAGCNALDYALAGVARVDAVDANPRQTALLELKLAAIRKLEFKDFFALFGSGRHRDFRAIYHELHGFSRTFWDRRCDWFDSRRGSFYYHGLSGLVARGFRLYLGWRPQLADLIFRLLETGSIDEQRALYDEKIKPLMWSRGMNWALSRQLTMSLLGVPWPQRREVQAQHPQGVAGFIRESIEYVFRELPVADNYFWSLYLRGSYTPDCCPEYLKPANFAALKGGLAARVVPHTCTVTEFLQASGDPVTRFVLLDHMDWMASYYPAALIEEWNAILGRAAPGARIIFRSAHARPGYLDSISVGAARRRLRDVLHFHDDLAVELTRRDRVHTYAGFHIADVGA